MISEEDVEALRVLEPFLLEELDVPILLCPLLTTGCLCTGHVDAIQYRSKKEKNKGLLKILKCTTVSQYKEFIVYLRQTGQLDLANFIASSKGKSVI